MNYMNEFRMKLTTDLAMHNESDYNSKGVIMSLHQSNFTLTNYIHLLPIIIQPYIEVDRSK